MKNPKQKLTQELLGVIDNWEYRTFTDEDFQDALRDAMMEMSEPKKPINLEKEINKTVNTYPFRKTRQSPTGTGFLTEVKATYKQLVEILGEPNRDGDGEKVQAEWHFEVGTAGFIVTIYDYKSNVPKEQVTEWHIGGKVKSVGELVKMYIENTIADRYITNKYIDPRK